MEEQVAALLHDIAQYVLPSPSTLSPIINESNPDLLAAVTLAPPCLVRLVSLSPLSPSLHFPNSHLPPPQT